MKYAVSAARSLNNNAKIGTCPHGLPTGACPICSSSGGGGGASVKKAPKPSNEMSWDECYSVWQTMKADKAKKLQQAQDSKNHAVFMANLKHQQQIQNLAANVSKLALSIANLASKMENIPPVISKPLIFIATKIALPIVNLVQNLVQIIPKAINFVKEKLADISDKLNALFGELKNATEKKISDKLNNIKKKLKSIFGFFESIEETEERQIQENKKILELNPKLEKTSTLESKYKELISDDEQN